jgi:hypothetical protein
MFYNESTGELRLSNGSTPGGNPISIVANIITAGSLLPTADDLYSLGTEQLRWAHIHLASDPVGIYFSSNTLGIDGSGSLSYNSGTGNVAFGNIQFNNGAVQSIAYVPGSLTSNLIPAGDNTINLGNPNHRFADLYLGYMGLFLADTVTDQNINITANAGTLYLDGVQNLALGNLVIEDTTLKSANPSLDISVGDTGDTGFFYVKRKAQIDNITFSSTQAMLGINASGVEEPATIFPDTLVQTTSRPDKNSRIVQRSYGSSGNVGGDNSYSVWAAYTARGNVSNPSASKQNDILSRLSSNGFGTTTWGTGGTRIESVALENFTDSAKGSKINFWTTPIGSIVSQQVASITATGISANAVTFTTDSTTQTTAGIPLTQRAVANGVATLGIDGRLTTDQIPSSLVGAIVFQGGWNAANNTPTLSNGTGVTGYQYIVIVGGTQNLGAGNITYTAGDTVTYGANVWNRVEGSSPISSVSGNLHMQVSPTTGAVVVGIDATPNTVASTVVSRDSNGNFQANIITAALSGQATSALTAATVTAGSQTAITQVGTLVSLAVTGNVTTGNVSATAYTGTTAIFSGNVTAVNINSNTFGTHIGAVTGNVTGNVTGTILTAAQPNITSVGTLTSLSVSGNISDSLGSVRSIPQNGKNANYTLQSTDNGQMINVTSGNITVPGGVFASPYGQTISIFNNQNSSNAVVQGSNVTLRLAGTAATGNRTLARYGVATVICVAANTFVISGAGLT